MIGVNMTGGNMIMPSATNDGGTTFYYNVMRIYWYAQNPQ
jgi:hypothetical protein